MSEGWKNRDRPCPPCTKCGAELYEKFCGNGGWMPTEKSTDTGHGASDCLRRIRASVRDKAQAIVDLAYARLCDSRTTEENTRLDLTQIVGLGRELLATVGEKPA